MQNVKIGAYEYDIVAISRYNANDIIFEIKYTKNPESSLNSMLSRQIKRINISKTNYIETTKHQCELTVMVVVPEKSISLANDKINKFLGENDKIPFKVEVISEEMLHI